MIVRGLLVAWLLGSSAAAGQQVVGYARLDAATFESGPTSGRFLDDVAAAPFVDRQTVQGFSGLVRGEAGRLLALTDNGFGARENSADHLLRLFELAPDFATGRIEVTRSIRLRDPHRRVPFSLVADQELYPGAEIPVEAVIREGRLLTGWDFDPESCQRMSDGTLWVGDEFGPFLLHFDREGILLEAPVALEGVHSPQNLLHAGDEATLPASGGFEGLALSPDQRTLYPLLEKPRAGDPPGRLALYRFDVERRVYDPPSPYRWLPLEASDHHIGDLACVDDTRLLVIERDDLQGPLARFKKIFLVDLERTDPQGVLRKREVVDLLHVPDPGRHAGTGSVYSMPLITIEGLLVFDEHTLCVVNDNNYPFSVGRHLASGAPDDDEMVLIGFDAPLRSLEVDE